MSFFTEQNVDSLISLLNSIAIAVSTKGTSGALQDAIVDCNLARKTAKGVIDYLPSMQKAAISDIKRKDEKIRAYEEAYNANYVKNEGHKRIPQAPVTDRKETSEKFQLKSRSDPDKTSHSYLLEDIYQMQGLEHLSDKELNALRNHPTAQQVQKDFSDAQKSLEAFVVESDALYTKMKHQKQKIKNQLNVAKQSSHEISDEEVNKNTKTLKNFLKTGYQLNTLKSIGYPALTEKIGDIGMIIGGTAGKIVGKASGAVINFTKNLFQGTSGKTHTGHRNNFVDMLDTVGRFVDNLEKAHTNCKSDINSCYKLIVDKNSSAINTDNITKQIDETKNKFVNYFNGICDAVFSYIKLAGNKKEEDMSYTDALSRYFAVSLVCNKQHTGGQTKLEGVTGKYLELLTLHLKGELEHLKKALAENTTPAKQTNKNK